jgi:hypothetical protein
VLERAVVELSGYSTNARGVERRELSGGGKYWQAFTFDTADSSAALLDTPDDFVPDATEVIFPLPNGLNGFFMANEHGDRLVTSQLTRRSVMDPAQPDGFVRNGVSCFSCHNQGIVRFTENMAVGSAVVFEQALAADNAAYAAAAELAGTDPERPDGVSRMYLDFVAKGVSQPRAAAELFITPHELQSSFAQLPPELFRLGRAGESLPREQFLAGYREAMCILQAGQNRPADCQ